MVTDNLSCFQGVPCLASAPWVSKFDKQWFRKWSDVEKVSSMAFYSFMLLNNLSYRVPFVPS